MEPPVALVAAGKCGQIMERKLSALSGRYLAALRKHLKQAPQGSLQAARAVGRQAVGLGLETLDMARIHEGALEALDRRPATLKRAMAFFAEAITPIERMHGPALAADAQFGQVSKALDRCAADLAVSARTLKQSIMRRRIAEEALKQSGTHSEKLLDESRRLQRHLRHLTQQILAAQESNRGKISRELQDEMAQTLLGINVRLLTLKKQGSVSAQGFQKEVAKTQRVVEKSAQSIARFTREFGKHHEA
jgi:signal transduction histidine kinase